MIKNDLISKRALGLKPSLTLEISALAQSLKKQGKDICSMSAGEPDFETPEFIVQATQKALKDGETKYGPAAGDPALREAIALKLTEINNVPSNPENILITNGGKQSIFNLIQVLINPGDEVIVPSPYWLSYPEIIRFAEGIPVFVESSPKDGFALNIKYLEQKINQKTKLLIINSPCNPTGQVMGIDKLQSIASLLRKYPNVFVISDEIYEFLISDEVKHYSLSSIAPDLTDRIFIVNGFAKSWAMTGWRIGYLRGKIDFVNKAVALQSQSTSNVCTFAQKGALAAIKENPRGMEYMIKSYNTRRKVLCNGLKEIKGLTLEPQQGAFYAFPCLNEKLPSSLAFCKYALEKAGLAIIPGAAFGNDRCIRISCSVSKQTISNGLSRLSNIINEISN